MNKISILVFFFFSFFSSFAQNTITIKGKVMGEKSQLAVESATVYLTSAKDSTIIDYTISDKNGFFKLNVKKNTPTLILKISHLEHQNFTQKIDKITKDTDLGILKLAIFENALNEVVIKSEAPPIRIKKDTLEFNASSFKMRPDANVEALLRQLPGVVIDANKKITVNGKEVNKILVNGKSFFGEDGKVALQNLPSDIIKKIQVSDTKTKEEELTKQASSSNNSTINLTIEKDKNKGLFGKFLGGYGTNKRYEGSALVSYFKNKRRISFLASSNNINSTGFSMDEVFDNMGGGGRNGYSQAFRGGNSGGGGNGGSGIIQSNLAGVNYTDEWFKDFNVNTNYRFSNSESKNNNKTKIDDGTLRSESESATTGKSFGHNLDLVVEYKIDSTTALYIQPRFSKGNNQSTTNYNATSRNVNNQLVNTTNSLDSNDSDNTNFGTQMHFGKQLKKKGRYFSTSFQNDNSSSDANALRNLATLFYQGNSPNVIRDQTEKTSNKNDKYIHSIAFREPITDSLSLDFSLGSEWGKTHNDKKTFNLNPSTRTYTDADELLSNTS